MTWFKKNFPDKKIRLRIYIILFILVIALFFLWPQAKDQVILKAGSCLFKVEIADTPSKHYQGLSNRSNLCQNCGMLFLFPDKQKRDFVMRNMNFPLDIIFIDNRRVSNIYYKAKPEGKNPKATYSSLIPIDAVLEINANKAKECGIKIGETITWSQ